MVTTTSTSRPRTKREPDALTAWLGKNTRKGTKLDLETIHIAGLRAQIVPTRNVDAYRRTLRPFLELAGQGASTPLVVEFCADERQPGWARLAVALAGDRVPETLRLARHTPALAEHGRGLGFIRAGAHAQAVLSPARQLRLEAAGALVWRVVAGLDDLVEAVVSAAGTSVFDAVVKAAIVAEPTPLPSLSQWLGAIDTLAPLVGGQSAALMTTHAISTLAQTQKIDDVSRMRTALLTHLATAVEMVSLSESVAEALGITPAILPVWAASGGGEALLAASALHSSERLRGSRPGVSALEILASEPSRLAQVEEIYARARYSKHDSFKLALAALTGIGTWAGENEPARARIITSLLNGRRWEELNIAKLRTVLGPDARVLAAVLARDLAPEHGYQQSGPRHLVGILPPELFEDLLNLTPNSDPLVGKIVGEDALDRARAQLLAAGVRPSGRTTVPMGEALLSEIKSLFLLEARGWSARDNQEGALAAWLRAISASDVLVAIETGQAYALRCNSTTTLVPPAADLMVDALALAAGGAHALAHALRTGAEGRFLPTHQRLLQYAAALGAAAERTS